MPGCIDQCRKQNVHGFCLTVTFCNLNYTQLTSIHTVFSFISLLFQENIYQSITNVLLSIIMLLSIIFNLLKLIFFLELQTAERAIDVNCKLNQRTDLTLWQTISIFGWQSMSNCLTSCDLNVMQYQFWSVVKSFMIYTSSNFALRLAD